MILWFPTASSAGLVTTRRIDVQASTFERQTGHVLGGRSTPGVASGHPAAKWVTVHRLDRGHLRQGHRVTADPTTQIKHRVHTALGKPPSLPLRHRLRAGLLDPGQVTPEFVSPIELRSSPATGTAQLQSGRHHLHRPFRTESLDLRRVRLLQQGDLVDQGASFFGNELFPRGNRSRSMIWFGGHAVLLHAQVTVHP